MSTFRDMPLDKLVEHCDKAVNGLIRERSQRQGGLHADDSRIATEIAEMMFYLGRARGGLKRQIEISESNIIRCKEAIEDLDCTYRNLQAELDIANHQA